MPAEPISRWLFGNIQFCGGSMMRFVLLLAFLAGPFCLQVFGYSHPFVLTQDFRGDLTSIRSIGFVGKDNLAKEYQEIASQFCIGFINRIQTIASAPEFRVMSIPSEKLNKINRLKFSRKNVLTTYLPDAANLTEDGFSPDLIIFIKRFESEEGRTPIGAPLPTPIGLIGVPISCESLELTMAYVFWDNRRGSVIGYGQITDVVNRDDQSVDAKNAASGFIDEVMLRLSSIMHLPAQKSGQTSTPVRE